VAKAVLDVDNVEASVMAFTVRDQTDTAQVMSTGDHAHVAWFHTATPWHQPYVTAEWFLVQKASGYGSVLTAGHLQATVSKLLT